MATNYVLKPFVINLNDLTFLLSQVNFVPLFDGPVDSNGIVNFDPATMDAWDAKGNQVWDAGTQTGSYQGAILDTSNVALLGQGFPQVSAPIGIRDVSGLHNNLFGTQADWGAVDVPFRRDIAADFSSYVTTAGADYTPGNSVIDYMPRIISRTITTAGVNLLQDSSGHYVNWDSTKYGVGSTNYDAAYTALIDASGVTIANLVDGAKIVAPVNTDIAVLDYNGDPLVWTQAQYTASVVYTTTIAVLSATSYGGLKDPTGGSLEAGEAIWYRPYPGGPLVTTGQTYQPDVLTYKQLIDANVDFSAGAPADGTAIVTTVSESGYGLLETLGHIDFQQPDNGEFFIGSENPGVAPVNSWFGIFGQFFDHGLDLIGKGGNGKVTIALDPSDPLYGVIGPDGQPTTSITINRATIAGTDANGDPNYVNHTSPFIDQSQTYGSVDQITQLLRKWIPDATNPGVFKAAMELFDGTTLADTWTRRWPDGTTTEVRDTLPTLNELRDHVLDTGRAALTWEDVTDYRNRTDGGQLSSGNSGHALILDMNPRFDQAHLSPDDNRLDTDWDVLVAGKVSLAITDLNASGVRNAGTATADVLGFTGGQLSLTLGTELVMGPGPAISAGTVLTGASALIAAGWVNPADFSILLAAGPLHDAVGEILMAAVGDHYIAGDGRVNENFGLTSIHHVFHEEHNFQVENLKGWIYKHDTNNPGAVDPHEQLHNWQVDTGTQDASGNFTYGVGGEIAWDADKMFNATKLLVEMEYQHAAVDQYARTVTPRIQEFVGYSTGVDSTISLEYSQVAFRFGHSTIRETIDAIDPSGWMLGNVTRYALEKAFLTPQTFAEEGVAAITLGLSHQQMNEVDEFITPALNQGLLGLPLDLAAINIARGRDLGIPTLNDFREGISLARYTSWADFGANMIHPESLVNFIAAYSFGGDVAKASAIMGLYDGTLADGDPDALGYTAADALAFMLNNATVDVELSTARDGFNHIDAWIGGLAEAHVPGGLLGETFDAVFVAQIQSLMDGDRFYYLFRLFGSNIHEEVNNGQFKDIVERNTGLEHLNGSIFAYADKYYDFNREADGTVVEAAETTPTGDHANHLYADTLAANPTLGIFSDGGASTAPNGTMITVTGSDFIRPDVTQAYIRDVRPELDPTQVHTVEGTPTSGADSHEVIVATDNADFIHGRSGDDTLYGEGGNDFIFGDGGVDRLYGGEGHDMIDTGEGPDLADGGGGKDVIYGRGSGAEVGGFDQLVGGLGNDLIIGGEGIDKLSGGSGDDIIYGDGLTNPEMGNTDAFTHGGDGNDYIDTGASGDLLFGEEGDDYMVGGIDQDLIQGGIGDDILRPGTPSQAINGGPDEVVGDDGYTNTGFDMIDFSDYTGGAPGVVADMDTQFNPLAAIDGTTPFPAWFQIEGVIGSQNNDTFIGTDVLDPAEQPNLFGGGNWLVGGSGSDTFTGRGGNDVIIGGSIRLDTLIGQYAGADNGNLALGSTAWLADAMQTAPGGSGYGNNIEDAYTGASNRALGVIGDGLLDNAALGTDMFEKHFTEMLRSRMFKDVVLGDNGVDSGIDVAKFTGNLADYTITKITFTPPGSLTPMTAYKIVDSVADRDGTDIVVGVQKFQFADQTVDSADQAHTGSLNIVDYQARGQLRQNGVVRLEAAGVIDDPDGHLNVARSWQRQNADGTWSNFGVLNSATLRVIDQGVYRFVETYTDSFGLKTVVSGQVAVVGSNVAQIIVGVAGNEIMLGMGGDDTLDGSAGDDIMDGGAGVDGASFAATTQGVTVNLGANATISSLTPSQTGAGTATGTEIGSDYLVSIANVTGGSGNDSLTGDGIANVLDGGAGNDILDGAAGNDTLTGGLGDDTIDGGLNADIAIYGKSVFSFNFARAAVPLEIADTDVAPATSLGTDTVSNVEQLQFTEGTYNLVLGTNLVNNPLNGTGNNDLILGFNGADTLNGNGGADILIGGLGADIMNGGGGNDTYVVDDAGDTITEGAGGGSGTDLVRSSVTRTIETNVENLILTGTDAINGTGNAVANIIIGNAGANILSGNAGIDTLTGGLGNDTLDGGTQTGAGDIAVFGKSVMSFDFSKADLGPLNVIDTDIAPATSLGTDTLTSIERVQFAEGTFNILMGDSVVNTITGIGNANELILGFDGDDILNGGNGADVINGGIGMDTITGGAGRDIMTGGANADTFVFATGNSGNTAATRDIVTDFAAGDRIDLLAWNAGSPSGDFASLFVDDFTVAGELRYYLDVNGNTIIEGNTDADADSEFQIQLNGAFELQHVVSLTEDYLIVV